MNDRKREAATQVLGFWREPGGYEPGGFITKLIEAYLAADRGNKLRLALGFPELAAALDLVYYEPDGFDKLREQANHD